MMTLDSNIDPLRLLTLFLESYYRTRNCTKWFLECTWNDVRWLVSDTEHILQGIKKCFTRNRQCQNNGISTIRLLSEALLFEGLQCTKLRIIFLW